MRNFLSLLVGISFWVSASAIAVESLEATRPMYEPSPLNFGLDLQFATGKYDDYRFSNGTPVDERSKAVNIAFEWIPTYYYGKPVIGASITPGVSANTQVGTSAAGAVYSSLNVLPISIYVGYRADFFVNQILVPFFKVGGSFLMASESSKTGGARGGSSTGYNFDYAVGIEFLMSAIDQGTQRTMDSRFGINHTYLVLEYFNSRSIKGSEFPNLSRAEYRLGLRFEI